MECNDCWIRPQWICQGGLDTFLSNASGAHEIQLGYFEFDSVLQTALMDLYAKCGNTEIARYLFDKMSKSDVILWNAMIAGYAQNGHTNEALALFNEMQLTDVKPNSVTMVNLLSACAHLGALQQGNWIHNRLIKSGLDSNVFVGTSLIDMYAKHGSVEHACRVFDRMSERTVVSWNAMIAGYAQNGYANEALSIFNKMQLADLKLNSVTVVAALLACAHSGAVQQGKLIHSYIMRSGFESNVFVGNALIDMYAKCGNIENARHVFDEMSRRDVVSWTAMISGYVQNGHDNEALAHFHRMQLAGVMPDLVTLVSVLWYPRI